MSRHMQRYLEIGRRLRMAREAAGLSQKMAARHLGRPQSYVSRCETGKRRLDIVELEAFCQLYDKSVEFFLAQD